MQLPDSAAPLLRAPGSSSLATLTRLSTGLIGYVEGVIPPRVGQIRQQRDVFVVLKIVHGFWV